MSRHFSWCDYLTNSKMQWSHNWFTCSLAVMKICNICIWFQVNECFIVWCWGVHGNVPIFYISDATCCPTRQTRHGANCVFERTVTVQCPCFHWEFLFISSDSSITVAVGHSSTQQCPQSSGRSSADTPASCCCLWRWWTFLQQLLSSMCLLHLELIYVTPIPALFLEVVVPMLYEHHYHLSQSRCRSVYESLQV